MIEVPGFVIHKQRWDGVTKYFIVNSTGIAGVQLTEYDNDNYSIVHNLYVDEKYRNEHFASELLDIADKLATRKILIEPCQIWQQEWYQKRGYEIFNTIIDD